MIRRTRRAGRPPRRSPRRSRPTCSRPRRRRGRCRTAGGRSASSPRRDGRCTSGSRAGRRPPPPRRARGRAAASSARSSARSRRRATSCGRSRPGRRPPPRRAASTVRRRRAGRRVRLQVRRGLPAVEDVVRRERDERRAELGHMLRPADVHRGGLLRIVLGRVDIRPGGGMQDERRASPEPRRRQRHVPVGARQPARLGKRLEQRVPELAGRACDEGAVRGTRHVAWREDRRLRAPQMLHPRIRPGRRRARRDRPGRTPR